MTVSKCFLSKVGTMDGRMDLNTILPFEPYESPHDFVEVHYDLEVSFCVNHS